jgi:hypothetical protein
MQHVAEIAVHQFLEKVASGEASFSEKTAKRVADDVKDAVKRQFSSDRKKDFTLRMSNVGRPSCQLWFEKNKPDAALPKPSTFTINMLIGDIVEAVFKGLLTEAGVKYEDSEKVSLDCGNSNVSGTYDLILDGAVDDIKSASDWSYRNKFESFDALASKDSFGYVAQLAGYSKAANKKVGGWWVVNKSNGNFKYVSAKNINVDVEVDKIKNLVKKVKENKFERAFQPVPEKFRGKETGNKILNDGCKFCSYRFSCFPTLVERPAVKSQAKNPPIVGYVELQEGVMNE